MKKFLILCAVTFFYLSSFAQDFSLFEKHVFVSNGDTLPYRLLLPQNYDASKKYPLVFFLHGAGERGSDNELQLTHGAAMFLVDSIRKNYPAIVVFPQCAANSFWSNVNIKDDNGKWQFDFPVAGDPTKSMALAQGLLNQLLTSFPLKKKHIYIAGLSMGGMGTFEMVRRNPTLFAAAMPICGGANPATANQLTSVKWWIFHGAKDNVVPPAFSQKMYDALLAAKAGVKFTMYPEADHNSWDSAFAEKDFMSWLFSQKRKN